jgi:hypothetical protein
MDDAVTSEQSELRRIYEEAGSWQGVAIYLNGFTHPTQPISSALAWKVANGKCSSTRITMALIHADRIDAPPPKVEVAVCPTCGELHQMQRTCPTQKRRDERKRRAWAGTAEEAEVVDQMVASCGHDSLAQMVDHMVDMYEKLGDEYAMWGIPLGGYDNDLE